MTAENEKTADALQGIDRRMSITNSPEGSNNMKSLTIVSDTQEIREVDLDSEMADRINRAWREKPGLTIDRLADAARVDVSTLADSLNGAGITIVTYLRCAGAVGLTTKEAFEGLRQLVSA